MSTFTTSDEFEGLRIFAGREFEFDGTTLECEGEDAEALRQFAALHPEYAIEEADAPVADEADEAEDEDEADADSDDDSDSAADSAGEDGDSDDAEADAAESEEDPA